MSLTGLHHVAVLTSDIDAFAAFYEDIFGARSEGGVTEDCERVVVLRIAPGSEIGDQRLPDRRQ